MSGRWGEAKPASSSVGVWGGWRTRTCNDFAGITLGSFLDSAVYALAFSPSQTSPPVLFPACTCVTFSFSLFYIKRNIGLTRQLVGSQFPYQGLNLRVPAPLLDWKHGFLTTESLGCQESPPPLKRFFFYWSIVALQCYASMLFFPQNK